MVTQTVNQLASAGTAFTQADIKRSNQLFRALFIMIQTLSLIYGAIYWTLGARTSIFLVLPGILAFNPLAYFLNRFGKFYPARFLLLFSCSYSIFMASLGTNHQSKVEFFCFPLMLIGFLLFDLNKKRLILSGMAASLLTWIFIKQGLLFNLPTAWLPVNLPYSTFETINFLSVFISTIALNKVFVESFNVNKTDKIKIIQNALKTTEKLKRQLQEAQRIAKTGSWTYGVSNQEVFWSLEMFNLFDEDFKNGPPSYEKHYSTIHKDDQTLWKATVEKSTRDGLPYKIRFRSIFPEKILWIEAIGQGTYDESGKVTSLFGTCQDITERVEAEEEIRFILDVLHIGVWKFNPINQALHWDKSMYQLYEIAETEFSGHYQAWESALTAEGKEKATEELQQALRGEKELNTVFEIKTPSRGNRLIAARGRVIRNSSGVPIMVYGINYDRTEEIETAEKLTEVTQNSPGLIYQFLMRPDGSTTMPYVIPEGLRMFDLTQADYEKDNNILIKCIHPEDKSQIVASMLESATLLKPFQWSGRILNKEGKTIWCLVKSTPRRLPDQSTIWSGFILNITKEKELEHQLTLEQVKTLHSAKLASLGEMSAGIAHEINNPLAIIASTIPLLTKFKNDPEKFESKIATLNRSVERIAKIIRGLTKFSRKANDSKFKREPLSLMIQEALTLTEAKSKRHSTPIQIELKREIQLLCDEVEIEQVLINLIGNAIDAVKDLSEKWVKISAYENDSEIKIRVQDSGQGIPDDLKQKLFDPFYTSKPVGQGTGLGLSISKGIIENHNGTLELDETDPHTCFEIRFKKTVQVKNEA